MHQPRTPKAREIQYFDFSNLQVWADLESYYWVDDRQFANAFGSTLPSRLADLIDLAMAVYYADRRSVRVRSSYIQSGQRNFDIRLPMRDLQLWSRDDTAEKLTDLLNWYTEDRWSFTFTPRQASLHSSEADQYLFSLPVKQPAVTVLFSGGLDSLAGLVAQLDQSPDYSFVLLSGCTHGRMGAIQRNLVKHLRRDWQNPRRELISIRIPFGLHKPKGAIAEEKGQRSRGFVFLMLGAVAAVMSRSQSLWVHENGIGAVNLWLNEGQLGVDNARGVHPLSLIHMAEFLDHILQRPLEIKNPCQFSTKAQMCQVLKRLGLDDLPPSTASCDGFPLRIRGVPQCGLCTSCLLRRLALHASGLAYTDLAKYYQHDVKYTLDGIEARKLYPLRATLDHVDRLETCLASGSPWETLSEAFPELLEIQEEMVQHDGGNPLDIQNAYVQMYRTYVAEWRSFPLGSLAATA